MNTIQKILATGAATAMTVGLALPVAAQGIYGTDSASVGSDTSVSSGSGSTNASSDTNVSGNASVDGIVDTGLGAGVKGVVNAIIGGSASSSNSGSGSTGSGSTGTSGGGSAQGSATVSANANSGVEADGGLIFITRADVNAGTIEATASSPSSVTTRADLSGFIAAQMQGDADIASVEVASGSVSVTHKQNAKLFGFIPVTVNATVSVDADGNVTVSYPWYTFLASTNRADLKAKIENRVDAVLGANVSANASAQGTLAANAGKNGVVSGNASATGAAQANANANAEAAAQLTAEAQAALIAEINAVMENELTANANASANAAANASGNANVN